MTLSQTELTKARDDLKKAEVLIAKVRDKYLEAGGVLDGATAGRGIFRDPD
jgi:hypothetical protein